MADRVGQQLGNYRLIRLLGRGGFAEVYLGEHLHLLTQAAVKVLHTRLASHDDRESFEKEARTVAHLKHPHVVHVFDYNVEEDTPFLVMEYAPGGTLRQRHPKGTRLPLPTIISYVKQVATALQYAHDQRLIHRDIKPENLLVGAHDELLLSDFGIATLAHSSHSLNVQQGIGGTLPYMAPEQIQGQPRPASDQYALGVVVYEWIAGQPPFRGTTVEIVTQHTMTPPPSLLKLVPVLPSDVELVVQTALEKDPHQRFSSVKAFATALEQASQNTRTAPSLPGVSFSSSASAIVPEEPLLQAEHPMTERSPSPKPSAFQTLPQPPLPVPLLEEPPSEAPAHLSSPPPGPILTPRSPRSEYPSLSTQPVAPEREKSTPSSLAPPTRPNWQIRLSPAYAVVIVVVFLLLLVGRIIVAATGQWPWSAHPSVPSTSTSTPTSVPGTIWHMQNIGTTQLLYSVVWSGSQFVAVGYDGAVLTSPDGHIWTAHDAGTVQALSGVAWSGSQFVAVGAGTIMTSPDGRTWTGQDAVAARPLSGVAWSGSQFVAVGDGGTIMTSPDGRTWIGQNSGTTQLLFSVVWSGSQFVAVGDGGTILTSADGRIWTYQKSGTTQFLSGVAWSGSQFVAVGSNGRILTSPDGRTWTYQNSGTTQILSGVAWSGSRFVAVGENGTILTSPDGHTWIAQKSGTTQILSAIAWSGSKFVVVGNGSTILTSP